TRSRISGVWLPWPGKSAIGAAGSVIKVTPTPCPAGTRGHSVRRTYPPAGGCASTRLLPISAGCAGRHELQLRHLGRRDRPPRDLVAGLPRISRQTRQG